MNRPTCVAIGRVKLVGQDVETIHIDAYVTASDAVCWFDLNFKVESIKRLFFFDDGYVNCEDGSDENPAQCHRRIQMHKQPMYFAEL